MAIWRATALALVAKAPRSAPRKRSMRLIGGASPSPPRRGLHPRLGIGQIRAREGRAGDEQAANFTRGARSTSSAPRRNCWELIAVAFVMAFDPICAPLMRKVIDPAPKIMVSRCQPDRIVV